VADTARRDRRAARLALLPLIGFEFMPIVDASQFSVKLEMPTVALAWLALDPRV
jgi:hypothetical protein